MAALTPQSFPINWPGIDSCIVSEILKNGGEFIRSEIHQICSIVYEKHEAPKQWTSNLIVPIPKKGNPTIVSESALLLSNESMSISFVATLDQYVFSDAIVGTSEWIESLTPEEIYSIELQRWNDWYAIVNPPVVEE